VAHCLSFTSNLSGLTPTFVQISMGFIIKIIVTALSVFVADYLLEGVHINADAKTVVIVALVLALLNTFVKPILVLLTIPVTVVTLGLFLLVINTLMVIWADRLISGFEVDGWLYALLFSLIVSVVSAILNGMAKRRE
jgi:putative membrane protein